MGELITTLVGPNNLAEVARGLGLRSPKFKSPSLHVWCKEGRVSMGRVVGSTLEGALWWAHLDLGPTFYSPSGLM